MVKAHYRLSSRWRTATRGTSPSRLSPSSTWYYKFSSRITNCKAVLQFVKLYYEWYSRITNRESICVGVLKILTVYYEFETR